MTAGDLAPLAAARFRCTTRNCALSGRWRRIAVADDADIVFARESATAAELPDDGRRLKLR
jgi:hypothetical protein